MDVDILRLLNRYIGASASFDEFVMILARNDLTKGGVFMVALWFFWMHPHPARQERRSLLLAGTAGALVAAGASRALCNALMLHVRPLHTPGLELASPFPIVFADASSSFPSDHASLAFGLAAATFFVSRWLGAALAVYAAVFVSLPRLYLGFHWPSDLLGGALLGSAVSTIVILALRRTAALRALAGSFERWPGPAYAVLFLVTFGVMNRFDNVRELGRWAAGALRATAVAVQQRSPDELASTDSGSADARGYRADAGYLARPQDPDDPGRGARTTASGGAQP